MPSTTREYKFELGEKLMKRWEKEYPDMRCVMVQDPERGGSHETISRYHALGYRALPLTTDEKFALMDTDTSLLMAVSKERAEENRKKTLSNRPDTTEEVMS